MKKLCILLLGMVSFSGMAQEKGTWSVSTHFQSDHNFIDQKPVMYYGHFTEPVLKKSFQFTTGLGVNYRFPSNLELSTGLRFSTKSQENSPYNYPIFFCGTVDYALIYNPPVTTNFVEVPLLARYYFLPGKLKMHVESGWVGSMSTERTNSSKVESWLLSAQSGVGVNYFLKRWQFGLSANYRLQFQLANRAPHYQINPHAFGFEFKTAFSLNN